MRTPYIPHHVGVQAEARWKARQGWLTAGVATSIAWPQDDVLVEYDGSEYLLRGVGAVEKRPQPEPCVSTPCPQGDRDATLAKLYRFASVLGWFKRGYVDVTGSTWSTFPIRYARLGDLPTTLMQSGVFSCNHMPVIEADQTRKALAFMREGRRLRHVHEPYSFLSFFKVIESQFDASDRVAWVGVNLDLLDGDAAKRVAELRATGVDVNKHLYASGRSAVAHASISGTIVDPDIPEDRKRIGADLVIIDALATRYVRVDAGVPDEMTQYRTRDRLAPWYPIMAPAAIVRLKAGGGLESLEELGALHNVPADVRLFPHAAPAGFSGMTLAAVAHGPGVVKFVAYNARKTIGLVFVMDVVRGQLHAELEEEWDGGLGHTRSDGRRRR